MKDIKVSQAIQFCSTELENHYIFCAHPKIKDPNLMDIKMNVSDKKDIEIDFIKFKVNFCPFCGFTFKEL